MKYLIAGLGNIGIDYHETRHNIGFMVLDQMAEEQGVAFEPSRYGSIATYAFKGRKLVLLKPSTFMNLSGKAVRHHLKVQQIPAERLLVVTDDLSLPFGAKRIRGKGSAGGHNGLKHIQETLGNSQYARMRIGIGDNFKRGQQVEYVLAPFSEEERPYIPDLLTDCIQGIQNFSTIGLARTMTDFNRKQEAK